MQAKKAHCAEYFQYELSIASIYCSPPRFLCAMHPAPTP